MSFLLPHFLKEGRGPHRSVFHSRLQSGVDVSRWLLLDRNAARRRESRPACRADSHVERDRMVCRLRSAHGLQLRAARLDEPGVVRGQMDRLPPAGESSACANERAKNSSTPTRRIPGRFGKRTSSGSTFHGRSIPMGRWASASISNRRISPGQKLTVDEYYGWMFENSVPGLPEAAKKEGLTPLRVHAEVRRVRSHDATFTSRMRSPLPAADLDGSKVEANGVVTKEGKPVGVMVEDKAVVGYNTPSRKLEIFSKTMADWKWPEFTLPEYYRSHIHRSAQAASVGQARRGFRSEVHADGRMAERCPRRGLSRCCRFFACQI